MKTLKFGMKADEVTSSEDFAADVSKDSADYNPYGTSYFDQPAAMATAGNYRITSIPSPYARMHITDLAFREVNTGARTMTANQIRQKVISPDYRRAMSHCLDVFEMLYRFRELDLAEKGITIHQVKLANGKNPDYSRILDNNNSLRSYIETLDLFRDRYLATISSRGYNGYKFDFSTLYIFKYRGQTFAASSPFTGFFAKADAKLVNVHRGRNEVVLSNNGHNYFTDNPDDYQDINERSQDFKEFMYILLKDGLGRVFKHLFATVEASFTPPQKTALDAKKFADEYPQFNFGGEKLPKINTIRKTQVYIRPDGLDTSYLKYLLYLDDPVQFEISQGAYEKNIEDRVFPDGTENKVPWLCINDLLADALVVLPYDIQDNFNAVSYKDENLNEHRRCLIPIKRKALDYLSLDELVENLSIRKYNDKHFAVSLKIRLDTGGDITLRREYYSLSEEKCTYPNGILVAGEETKRFAFGIYPFVKSEKYDNIYKVLFYNAFNFQYALKYYYYDVHGKAQEYLTTKIATNQTNSMKNKSFPTNCHYYQVHDNQSVNDKKIHIEFVELEMTIIRPAGDGRPEQSFSASSIIAPLLRQVANVPGETIVAVDLGTSNTYMAYHHEGDAQGGDDVFRTITTMHGSDVEGHWNELAFMNKTCTTDDRSDMLRENQDDLYLRQSDNANEIPSDICLPAQLCEFTPTRIVEEDNNTTPGYKFPIPSVVNNLRINCGNDNSSDERLALVHSSIPFGYYKIGKRKNTETIKYDNFAEGRFKWFYTFDENVGYYKINEKEERNFNAFLEELLFIVRSHMLCKGYNLKQCKLIWTYPISFQQALVEKYKEAWDKMFCRFFNTDFISSDGHLLKTANGESLDNFVMSTNESRTPLFECCKNPIMLNHFTVLMDVGGGSTDVIGYHKPQGGNRAVPKFLTSFNFAGNALYLDGGKGVNHDQFQQNIVRHFMENACQNAFNTKSPLNGMECINLKSSDSLSARMNYGFSCHQDDFNNLFKFTPKLQFFLKLHNAALLYHTAQICKICSPNEKPKELYLSGNGSKLFQLNTSFDTMMKEIFKFVYDSSDMPNIDVRPASNPKSATAIGSLKGYRGGNLAVNADARIDKKVLLGDDKTIYTIGADDSGHNLNGEDTSELKKRVYENVKTFITMFYEKIIGNANAPITKKEMEECLDLVQSDPLLDVRDNRINNTFFFNHIALMMEQVSVRLYNNRN